MTKLRYYVVPHSNGWAMKTDRGSAPAKVFRTQVEAIDAAKTNLRSTGGQLKIQNANGTWRSQFTLGRDGMGSISAVEGIRLSSEAKARFRDFDRKNLSDRERREAISRTFAKKG